MNIDIKIKDLSRKRFINCLINKYFNYVKNVD